MEKYRIFIIFLIINKQMINITRQLEKENNIFNNNKIIKFKDLVQIMIVFIEKIEDVYLKDFFKSIKYMKVEEN